MHYGTGDLSEVNSIERGPGKVIAQVDESKSSEDDYALRWESYRSTIRKRLDELLDEVKGSPVSMRLARALGIEDTPSQESGVKKRIVDYLMEAKDKYAIPKMVRLHEELCKESPDRLAERVADCIDLILPLYFSRETYGFEEPRHTIR